MASGFPEPAYRSPDFLHDEITTPCQVTNHLVLLKTSPFSAPNASCPRKLFSSRMPRDSQSLQFCNVFIWTQAILILQKKELLILFFELSNVLQNLKTQLILNCSLTVQEVCLPLLSCPRIQRQQHTERLGTLGSGTEVGGIPQVYTASVSTAENQDCIIQETLVSRDAVVGDCGAHCRVSTTSWPLLIKG